MGSLKSFVPEHIYNSKDSSVFITILEKIYNDIKGLISRFPELADVDNVSEIFLPKLAELIKYQYNYNIDLDIQREIIKRMIETYRRRGTDDSIIMAATYGNDEKWIADHLFLPGADKDKDMATLTYGTDGIFTHNISKFDGTHKFADSVMWRGGILIINLPFLNNNVRNAIKKVIPAGIKILFNIQNNSKGDGLYGELTFGEWVLLVYYDITYEMILRPGSDIAIFDVIGTGERIRSGRRILSESYLIDYQLGVSMLPIEDNAIYTNSYLRDAKPDDLIRTELSNGRVIYKKVKNLTNKDSIRVNRNPDIKVIFNENNNDLYEPVFDRSHLPDRSMMTSLFSGLSPFSGRNKKSIPKEEIEALKPKYEYQELLKTSFKDSSVLLKLLNLKLTDSITIDNSKEENKIIRYNTVLHSIDYNVPEIEVRRRWLGIPYRSKSSSRRSYKYGFSGGYTGVIFMSAPLEDVVVTDRWYPVNSIEELRPSLYNSRYQDAEYVNGKDKIYEGINYVCYVRSNNYYVRTTEGIELINQTNNPILIHKDNGEITYKTKDNLSAFDEVECYSLGIYLKDYTTDVEVIIEKIS